MPEFVCPACQAEIEPDLIEKTGQADCPYCGADVSGIGLPRPAEAEESGRTDHSAFSSPDDAVATGAMTRPVPDVPDKSRIKVIESTPDQLVLFVPGGGTRTAGLGLFAIVWNGFMCVFTPVMLGGILNGPGGNSPQLLFAIPFLMLFWAIGMGFAWFWLKFKYERTFVLLDRERIAIQKILFNRKSLTELPLGPNSRADLVEAYQQNDTLVYRIEVQGVSGAAKFGTALGDGEKDWIVDRINEFLGIARESDSDDDLPEATIRSANLVYPNDCEKCGAPLVGKPEHGVLTCNHCRAAFRGRPSELTASAPLATPKETYEPLTADSVAEDSGIRIIESSPEHLVFRTSLASDSPLRWIIPLFALPFSVAWYSFIGFSAWTALREPFGLFGVFHLLFLVPFFVAGLFPLGIGLYAVAGSTTVTITREWTSCRWGAGPFGYARHVPTPMIDSVKIETFASRNGNRRVRANRGRAGSSAESRACVVRANGKLLPLTILEEAACARQVASLVRTKLEELGRRVDDV